MSFSFLDMRVSNSHLLGPDFSRNGKENITVRNLLLHNAGFPPDPTPNYCKQVRYYQAVDLVPSPPIVMYPLPPYCNVPPTPYCDVPPIGPKCTHCTSLCCQRLNELIPNLCYFNFFYDMVPWLVDLGRRWWYSIMMS